MLSQHLCAPPSHGPRTSHSSCQGSGKEVRPHPLSYWCVQMSTGPALCSFTAICSCLLSTWCPEMAPVQGMLLGCRGCSWVQNQQQGAGGEEVLLPICVFYPLNLGAALGAEGKEPGFWSSNPSPTSCKSVSLSQSLSLSAVSSSPAKWGQYRSC